MFTRVIDLSYPLHGRRQMIECEGARLNLIYRLFPTIVHTFTEI